MSRVVVLGGGPAGLYASLLLARRGIPVTLIERESVPGGLTAGDTVAGVAVDHGSHRLHPSIEPDILEDLRSLLGADLQRRRRNGRIRIDGSWVSFPISAGEMLTELRPPTIASLAAGALRAAVTPSRSDTFADVVSTGLGRPMGRLFYFPYATKIWGVSPEQLSGEQARRRISADSPWKLARKAMQGGGWGRDFYYPREGFGQIARALASAAREEGADIRMGATATSISGGPGNLQVGTENGSVTGRLILSTIPVTALARFLDPPGRIHSSLESLRYRAMTLVYLVVDAGTWTEYDAHYFPEAEVPFTRISEPKNYRDGPDPDGRTVLCVEIPCDPGDGTWEAPDRELISLVRADIVGLGLPDPGRQGEVRRLRNAYPIYGLGSEGAFAEVADWLATRPGLVTFGRQGLFAHDNTHHALVMARDAASCVSDDLGFDETAWDLARERFARHIVED